VFTYILVVDNGFYYYNCFWTTRGATSAGGGIGATTTGGATSAGGGIGATTAGGAII
jgi:hypothetical protein